MSIITSAQALQNTIEHSWFLRKPRFALQLSERRLILLLGDLLLVSLASVGALIAWGIARPDVIFDRPFILEHINWFTVLPLLWLLLLFILDGYELKVAANLWGIGRRLSAVFTTLAIVYLLFFFLAAEQPQSLHKVPLLGEIRVLRVMPVTFLVVAFSLELIWRSAYASLLTKDHFQRRILIMGAGRAGNALIHAFRHEQSSNTHRIVGFIDDDPSKQQTDLHHIPVLGCHQQMAGIVQQHAIDEIVIAVSDELVGGAFQSLMDCYERGVQITPMPVIYENLTGRIPVEHVGKQWHVSLPMSATPPGRLYEMAMRTVDVLLALAGLTFLLALCPLIMLANYFWSPGPLFYSQTRVGRAGKLYRILKFRSMVPDAEKISGAVWAQAVDMRITPVGHILRKTRLDEIPQVWNVLKGEMSMIGPRPERPEFVEELAKQIPFYKSRHAVKPGLTGWAQVKYEYGASVEDALIKLQYDLYYIKHRSWLLNLLILYKTVNVVLGLKGR